MNILYISCLSGNPWAGPTYSVPAQITAQSKVDNVFWYDFADLSNAQIFANFQKLNWKNFPFYHGLEEFPHKDISKLPVPFNKPDLIVLEQLYVHGKLLPLLRWIKKSKIPYVFIPRGELTHDAQQKKWLKKQLANWLFFYGFAHKASAIEYLTDQEAKDSGVKWNQKQIIIANGITLPPLTVRTYTSNQPLKLVFLGRLDPYHKGIDLLLQACHMIADSLGEKAVSIDIYGPDRLQKREEMEQMVKSFQLNNYVRFHDGLYGEQKAIVLKQADVFIMTSRFEGHPMGLIEALAYGLPCVVTTGTNMRSEIEKYNAGWTADNTAESIALAIKKMLSEREQFAQKSQNARKLAERYDWDRLAQESHEIYKEILGKRE